MNKNHFGNQKGFTLTILLVLAAVLIGGGYLGYKRFWSNQDKGVVLDQDTTINVFPTSTSTPSSTLIQNSSPTPVSSPRPSPLTSTIKPSPSPTLVPTSTQSTPLLKEFNIIAKQFSFEPPVITVKKGDKIKLTVRSTDVTHGLAIPDFGVNLQLVPGEVKTAEFIANKTGEFRIFCSVFCGSGHSHMTGTLIVGE